MLGIAGSEGAVSGEGYARDLGVAEVDRTSGPLTHSSKRSRPLGRGLIEVQYPSLRGLH